MILILTFVKAFYISDHYTPRFPNNLTHLIHEYVTVDDLHLYRKKQNQNVLDGNLRK